MRPLLLVLGLALAAACGGSPAPGERDAGAERDADVPRDGGEPDPELRDVLERGPESLDRGARETFAGIRLRAEGGRRYTLEVLRSPDYSATHRLVVRATDGRVLWTVDEAPGEQMMDFAVHPSGEVTVSVERTSVDRGAYDLLRLAADGSVVHRGPLAFGETLPDGDLGELPRPPWRMRARPWHALTDGWVRLEARGEDVVTGFLSLAEEPGGVLSNRLVSGVMSLRWTGAGWEERWARLVDPPHHVEPPLWAYDEFRWGEVLVRPLLAVDEDTGAVVVGRTWTQGRCRAVREVFGEFSIEDCFGEDVASNVESRILPFAFTAFSADGSREPTRTFRPESGFYYGIFAMAARGGEVALGGATSRVQEDGTVAFYPARPGAEPLMVPFDALVAVLDRATGRPRLEVAVDQGRGDYVAAMRWTDEGLLVAGGSDWDRWNGGMSVSRGADPLLALVSSTDGSVTARTFPVEGIDRHHHLLAVDVDGRRIVAVGPTDAPMTHAGDGGHTERMTFGGLTLALAPP